MRLVKLTVNAFQCIEAAEVDFGPGLNVLYGPNDLGKSSLAWAIRAVLLLPHGSSAHEKLLSWHSGDAPRVELTFGTEEQRFQRVRKTFGSGSAGSSALEFSNDGSSFSVEATGREVDAKLRDLLRWGISKPGGRSGSKGLPDSFLTNVLLAEQVDVPNILARGLMEDPDESGRERLNEALQALAQDPLFKRILNEAHAHIDHAFTSTGQRSRRQGSPFQEITEEINQLRRQRDALWTKLNETTSAEANLQKLHAELDALTGQASDAKEKLDQVREARAQTQARAAVDEELLIARKEFDDIKAELIEVDQAAKTVETLQAELEAAEKTLVEKSTAERDAALAHDQTKDQLQQVTSEKGAQARELQRRQLENDRLKKRQLRTELQSKVEAAEHAERLGQETECAQKELEHLREETTQAEEAVALRAKAQKSAKEEIEQLKLVEAFGRLEHARKELKHAQEAAASAKADREKAAERRDEAEKLEEQLVELAVPDADVVTGLRALAQDLEVAEARLGGGLSVALKPRKDIRLQVAVDGEGPDEHRGRDPISLEVQRSLQLQVEDLLEITITAGEAAARTQVEELRRRWAEEGVPVLRRAGVADTKALEDARRKMDDLARQAVERRSEAQALEQKVKEHEERAGKPEVLQQSVAEREQAFTNRDQTGLAAQLGELGDSWETELDRRQASAETRATEAVRELDEWRSRVTELKTRLVERQAAYQKTRESAERALAVFPNGVQKLLEQGCRDLKSLDRTISDLTQRIDGLSNEAEAEVTEAQRILEETARRLEEATEARKGAETGHTEKGQALAKATGILEDRNKQAERLDVKAAEMKVADVESKLAGMLAPEIPVTEEDVEVATNAVRTADRAVADKQGEIHKAQGGLEQVGGAVVREQKEEIDRALQIALDREHEVEVAYEAWKLLAETLRDVENTDGAHLGKALSGPVSARFRELTANRYGGLAIGPHLEMEGLEAAGQIRLFDALSVGTKDQLATLFRICIAEHLHNTVVLDDHLSQSDPDKIEWFRDLLRRTGQTIQVVLLTCRPQDYLHPDEFPDGDEVSRDRAAGFLHAVNLARAICRYSLASMEHDTVR